MDRMTGQARGQAARAARGAVADATPDFDPRTRAMAVRAIMDGRGTDVAVLTAPDSVRWLTAGCADVPSGAAAVIITATGSVVVAGPDWAEVARIVGQGRSVGFESGSLADADVAAIRSALDPARMICLAADTARLCAAQGAQDG